MRHPQIVIAMTFSSIAFLSTFISLWFLQSSQGTRVGSVSSKNGMHTFFSFQTPFSLFPPNALITLTNDNTTSFLARPAVFGPNLPLGGLSGQVWIGSASDGELGCSDVPGWSASSANPDSDVYNWRILSEGGLASNSNFKSPKQDSERARHRDENYKVHFLQSKPLIAFPDSIRSAGNDLTDDFLYQPVSVPKLMNSDDNNSARTSEIPVDTHFMQEEADIAGKVVLLKRGGCGFLEKVKWSQRRGAVALIVGDNTMGEPLIQMFARGETFDVTIPSVFTSYTTAQLLRTLAITSSTTRSKNKRGHDLTSTRNDLNKSENELLPRSNKISEIIAKIKPRWLSYIPTGYADIRPKHERNRPRIDGLLDSMFIDNQKTKRQTNKIFNSAESAKSLDLTEIANVDKVIKSKKLNNKEHLDDDFVIGVQDWRDSYFLKSHQSKESEPSIDNSISESSKNLRANRESSKFQVVDNKQVVGLNQAASQISSPLKGGSIIPSSGEYTLKSYEIGLRDKPTAAKEEIREKLSSNFIATFDHDKDKNRIFPKLYNTPGYQELRNEDGETVVHEGLWVTLSPNTGTNPFLDTLLVLVVSPLVTLTVVYILLLIRSRYRRQRWRAPKSVVERLPVRTYQRIVSRSPRLPSSSNLSVTTPLLQGISISSTKPQIINGVLESSNFLYISNEERPLDGSSRTRADEGITNEPISRKKHTGTQVECVVCLEEYIDGVSRIMGLPCGHEFHVDCITPWLTNRRRTCPICKSDVVRSLARESRYESFQYGSVEQETHLSQLDPMINNNSSITQINVDSRNDVELGDTSFIRRQLRRGRTSITRGLLAGNFLSYLWNLRSMSAGRNR